jgi:hypothetical protein
MKAKERIKGKLTAYCESGKNIIFGRGEVIGRDGHNFRCPLKSLLSIKPLINGKAHIFYV